MGKDQRSVGEKGRTDIGVGVLWESSDEGGRRDELIVKPREGDDIGRNRFSSPAPKLIRLSILSLSEPLRIVGEAAVDAVAAAAGKVTVPPFA